MLIEYDDTGTPNIGLRDQLRSLDHFQRAKFIREELLNIYDKQKELTQLSFSGAASPNILIMQRVLSEHVKTLRAIAAENFRSTDYLLPKPIAIAIGSDIIQEKEISLVAGGARLSMSDILTGVERTEEL